MTRKTIVFIGSCQADTLGKVYRAYIAPLVDQSVRIVALSPRTARHELAPLLAQLRGADIIVEQIFDSPSQIPAELLGQTVTHVKFPLVAGSFLWPFGTEPHLRNEPHAQLQDGPYEGEFGDAFLNRLIRDGVCADDAVARYRELDIARAARADRVVELHLDRQRQRDGSTGIRTVERIEAGFRTEAMFLSRGHLSLDLFRVVAAQIFEQLEVPYSLAERALRALRQSPFPLGEVPIHPRLAEHLGLSWVTPDRRYRFLDEGRFSFDQFVVRYMGYVWEPDLREGVVLAHRGENERSRSLLESSLQRCPESVSGWKALGLVYSRLGRFDEAEAAISRAIAIDADDPEGPCARARMLLRQRRIEEAEACARQAIDLFPLSAAGHYTLAEVLGVAGRFRRAAQVALYAAELVPGDLRGLSMAAHYLARDGDLVNAEARLRMALEHNPDEEELRATLADILARTGRPDAAVEEARRLAAANPGDPHRRARLGVVLRHAGDLAGAEAEMREAIRLDPSVIGFHNSLADILARADRLEEAIAIVRPLVESGTDDAHAVHRLGFLLARLGELEAAEVHLRRAVAMDPSVQGFQSFLAEVLGRLGKLEQAVEILGTLAQADEHNAHIHYQYGAMLARAGDATRAEPALRRAVALEQNNEFYRRNLADLLTHAGRVGEAMAIMRRGGSGEVATGMPERQEASGEAAIPSVTDRSKFEIDFRRGGAGQECLIAGWSSADDSFTWTLGTESVVILPRLAEGVPHALLFSGFPILRTDVAPEASFQRIGLSVNGTPVGTVLVRGSFEIEIVIPANAAVGDAWLMLKLALPDACAPSEFKDSGDRRKLGIAFSRMVLRPIATPNGAVERAADDALPDRDILTQIQNLGANCELGFVQRAAGAEPFGLFRWGSAPLPNLLAALAARFDGLGTPENLDVYVDDADEFQILDKRFGFRNHSFAFQNKGGTREGVLKREVTRVPFLTRLLIEELESASKLFLFHDAGTSPLAEIEKLQAAIRRYGDGVLLWVVPATSPEQVGKARLLREGLICGYLAHFQPLGRVRPQDPKSLDAWLSMLRQAYDIWRSHD